MKPESLVIANQICRGEYVLESCTHCPSSQGRREHAKPSTLHRNAKSRINADDTLMNADKKSA